MERRKGGQTLFYGILPATAEGPKNTNLSNLSRKYQTAIKVLDTKVAIQNNKLVYISEKH